MFYNVDITLNEHKTINLHIRFEYFSDPVISSVADYNLEPIYGNTNSALSGVGFTHRMSATSKSGMVL